MSSRHHHHHHHHHIIIIIIIIIIITSPPLPSPLQNRHDCLSSPCHYSPILILALSHNLQNHLGENYGRLKATLEIRGE